MKKGISAVVSAMLMTTEWAFASHNTLIITSVVEYLASKRVAVVVAEGFGGPIADLMKSKGIKAVAFKGGAEGVVKNVLQPK
jgi:predicted Fe-Mo cluster-binding NifX family protein